MTELPSYPLERLDYALPPELIAQQPLSERSASRLLYVDAAAGRIEDRRFAELPQLLPADTLMVLNDSRVIPARLWGRRLSHGEQGGGRVELLFHRYLADGVCEAVVGSNARLKAGELIELAQGWRCELREPKALDGIRVRFDDAAGAPAELGALLDFLERHGEAPLPPYIKRPAEHEAPGDRERYQTVYAGAAGSVAAPTAGLHFDAAMLERLAAQGCRQARVTLHVGLGTFAPLRVADLREHTMHEEAYSVAPAALAAIAAQRSALAPLLAVGTTSLRVLHTLEGGGEAAGLTRAFIYPGRGTQACDMLLTNFHLPRSTLLALVYAFGGEELLRQAYAHAVVQRYRFFSYGDCMLIKRT